MGAVREWLTSVIVVTLLISVVQMLIPEGALRKTASFISGLILLLVLLRSLPGAERIRLDFSEYERDITCRQQELRQEGQAVLKSGVEEKLAEYILQQAAQRGISVEADVRTEIEEDGLLHPVDVYLEGDFDRELSNWIAEELNIPTERQFWEALP